MRDETRRRTDMTNTQAEESTAGLYVAMELSEKKWNLAFTDGTGERYVTVAAWDQRALREAVEKAKGHFGLGRQGRVRSCYEAGRCGFSLHRFLTSLGIENLVVDPGSIEVARGRKHRKTDRLDAAKLLRMLLRYWVYQERTSWRVCRVPSEAEEAARRVDREWMRQSKERTGHVSRIRSLLALHGVKVGGVRTLVVGAIRDWSGRVLAAAWQEEIGRELARLRAVDEQLRGLRRQMEAALEHPETRNDEWIAALESFPGVGVIGATALVRQFFGWRDFRNVREVGAAAGLTGCPFDSGEGTVEQGISKAGSRRIRTLAVELAWMWRRYQPESALTRWYEERFGHGGKRTRRIGIVALARKLLVALWKFLKWGLLPAGAVWLGASAPSGKRA